MKKITLAVLSTSFFISLPMVANADAVCVPEPSPTGHEAPYGPIVGEIPPKEAIPPGYPPETNWRLLHMPRTPWRQVVHIYARSEAARTDTGAGDYAWMELRVLIRGDGKPITWTDFDRRVGAGGEQVPNGPDAQTYTFPKDFAQTGNDYTIILDECKEIFIYSGYENKRMKVIPDKQGYLAAYAVPYFHLDRFEKVR